MKPLIGRVGVDLDNTIICYDQAFHHAAAERGWIDPAIPATKSAVKQAVLEKLDNRAWTELQGFVYGPGIAAASPYPGVLGFFQECSRRSIPACIISHKTRHAAAGPPHDLREAALSWLGASGLFDAALKSGDIFFADTRSAKLEAVRDLGCRTLIDDLPEIFHNPSYPTGTDFILFDPDQAHPDWRVTPRASSWAEISAGILL